MALVRTPLPVGDYRAELGESPIWDARQGRLLWLDILKSRLLRTDPLGGNTEIIELDRRTSAIALTDGDALLAAAGRDIGRLDAAGMFSSLTTLPPGDAGRCNDGKPDAAGRFWVGTANAQGLPAGALYRYIVGAAPEAMVGGIAMSNGLGWSPDNRIFYYVDTGARRLDAFDFDLAAGTLANRRTLLQLPEGQLPDGLTVDAAGRIWLAVWGGACVLVLDPGGNVEDIVRLPTSRVASCSFGGGDLSTLFVTTAQEGATAEELAADPLAGALFAVETSTHSLPPNRARM